MRHFQKPTSLDRLSLEARVIYTIFSLFMLVGYATSVWFYLDDGLGTSPSDTQRYYLGEAVASVSAPDSGGPALDVPEEAAPMRFEKPARQVMETAHFHLFSVPICLLILAHIFMMGRESTRTKVLTIGLASASTLVHVMTPPLVRFASPSFAFLMFPSAISMSATWLYMTASPVIQMWYARRSDA
jgi:hypothetical protein